MLLKLNKAKVVAAIEDLLDFNETWTKEESEKLRNEFNTHSKVYRFFNDGLVERKLLILEWQRESRNTKATTLKNAIKETAEDTVFLTEEEVNFLFSGITNFKVADYNRDMESKCNTK